MKRILSLLTIVSFALFNSELGAQPQSASMWFASANWQASLTPWTNSVVVEPVSGQAESDGTYLITGGSQLWTPSSAGIFTNFPLLPGNYQMTILPNASWINPPDIPKVFAVPSGGGVWNCFQPGIAISGYNTYNYTPGWLQLTNLDGTVTITPGQYPYQAILGTTNLGSASSVYIVPGNGLTNTLVTGTTGRTNLIGLNGTAGGGGGSTNSVSASAPVVAVTNVSGGVTNVTFSLAANPQYFKTNLSGQLDFLIQNQTLDTRPTSVADVKQVSPTQNVPYQIFTNSSPCTLTEILIDYGPYWDGSYNTYQPTLAFIVDGVSNGCQLPTFFAAQGCPSLAYHGEFIDIKSAPGAVAKGLGSGLGVVRQLNINCKTNVGITITFPQAGVGLWSDVTYRVGAPVVTNTWHMTEAQQLTAGSSGVFSIASVSGKVGQLESIVLFSIGNVQNYLEARPTVILDGNPILANGTEDFFGGSWYWQGGAQAFGTPQWGNESGSFLLNRYSSNYANCSYRTFQNTYFNSSFVFNLTNVVTQSVSNDSLVTYTTIP